MSKPDRRAAAAGETRCGENGMEKIGFIGLGRMGQPMACNVAKAGFALAVYDLAPEPVAALRRAGAQPAADPAELARASDIVITMLPSAKEVHAVAVGLANTMRPGSLLVDMSTSHPATTRALGDLLGARGIAVVDAPVAKGIPAAETGTLTIMAGGTEADLARCRPVLEAMGERIVHCGALGAGHITKIVNNLLVGVLVPVCAEAMALGVKAGVTADRLMEVITTGSGGSFVLDNLIRRHLLRNDYAGVFSVDYMLKDMNLALDLGREHHVPMMFGGFATQLYEAVRNDGAADDCYVVVARLVERLTGVAVRSGADSHGPAVPP